MNPLQASHEDPIIPKRRIKSLFSVNTKTGVSDFRFYLLRLFYAMAIFMLGIQVWQEILTHEGPWQPLPAVAFSFWGAFSALAILGVLYPLKMIPILLVQFSYKLIWLLIVAYPLWASHQLTSPSELTKANIIGIILDILIIPWGYVCKTFILGSNSKV